jgi:hypothetical protein
LHHEVIQTPIAAEAYAAELNNRRRYYQENSVFTNSFIVRHSRDTFHGILIDTGAALNSTAGYDQYLAYNDKITYITLDTSKDGAIRARFGIGSTTSIGSITTDSPIGTIEFHIVHTGTPFLLCLQDMDKLGVYVDNLRNVIVGKSTEIPVTRHSGHIWLQ